MVLDVLGDLTGLWAYGFVDGGPSWISGGNSARAARFLSVPFDGGSGETRRRALCAAGAGPGRLMGIWRANYR